MPGQSVEEALDVGFEDAVDDGIVRLVEVLPQSVPEVKGNFYHLFGEKNSASRERWSSFSLRAAGAPSSDGSCSFADVLCCSSLHKGI